MVILYGNLSHIGGHLGWLLSQSVCVHGRLAFVTLGMASTALAHSGGLNTEGCHINHKQVDTIAAKNRSFSLHTLTAPPGDPGGAVFCKEATQTLACTKNVPSPPPRCCEGVQKTIIRRPIRAVSENILV